MAVSSRPFYRQGRFILALVLLVIIGAGLWLYFSHANKPATQVTPDSAAMGGDAAKTRLSQSSPTPAPGQSASQNSPTPTPVSGVGKLSPTPSSGRYIDSFSVVVRSDGFHIASVITGLTSGSCQVAITPAGGSQINKTGSVTVSGSSYMCSFGGDIPGSGTSGSATLTVTAPNGSSDQMEASF